MRQVYTVPIIPELRQYKSSGADIEQALVYFNGDAAKIREHIFKSKGTKREMATILKLEREENNFDDLVFETPGTLYWRDILEHYKKAIKNIDLFDYKFTEDEAARLFVDIFKNHFRYNTTSENFIIWTGTHWTPDFWNVAKHTSELIGKTYQERLATMDTEMLKACAGFIKRIRSAGGVRSILFFVSSDPRISTCESDYNTNLHVINTPAGVYNLQTGITRDHRQSDLMTMITSCSPDKNHKTKYFEEFLNKITLGRDDLKEALQRYLGSGCSGRTPKEKAAVFYGEGSNGKTVLLETAFTLLGEYTGLLSIKSLTYGEKQSSGHTDDIASLHGKRYCIVSEMNEGVRLDEGSVKKLTGGDTIPVSRKHGRTFNMKPCISLFFLTNKKPQITGRDHGIWRRIALFPFDYKVPDAEQDIDFKIKMIESDGPYILAWMLEGCQKWYKDGYGSFETLNAATAEYKKHEDTLESFIDDCCKLDPGFSVQAGRLKTAFDAWAKENGDQLISGRAWREGLEAKGFTRSKGMYGATWKGLTLVEPEKAEKSFYE